MCVIGRVPVCHHVGDGGNDVSMIQAANVGIGIVGKVCVCVCVSVHCTFCYRKASKPH